MGKVQALRKKKPDLVISGKQWMSVENPIFSNVAHRN
jgi:hypothetical protein